MAELQRPKYGPYEIKIEVDTSQLDQALEKINQLAELLREVNELIDLSPKLDGITNLLNKAIEHL